MWSNFMCTKALFSYAQSHTVYVYEFHPIRLENTVIYVIIASAWFLDGKLFNLYPDCSIREYQSYFNK